MSRPIVTYSITIDDAGNVTNDVQTHGSTFGEVYSAFHAIKEEVNRQILERRHCPFNPVNHPKVGA